MSLHVVATIDAKPGHSAPVETALRAMLSPTRLEPGCLIYELHQDNEQPNHFVMIEHWRTVEALEQHIASAHFEQMRIELEGQITASKITRLTRLN